MIRISFDVDGTLLDRQDVKDLAKELSERNDVELWIHTRRFVDSFEATEVMTLAKYFNIPKERVVFTNRAYKGQSLFENKIHIHIDDDPAEAALVVMDSTYVILQGRLFNNPNYDWISMFWNTFKIVYEQHNSND